MNITPIKYGSVDFKKCELVDNRLLIGIDCGSALTKVIFLPKDNEAQLLDKNIHFVTLNQGLFNNKNFEDALKWIKEKSYFPEDTHHVVHITGKNAMYKKDIIESILGVKTEYVDENLTKVAGFKIAFEQIGPESLLSAPVEFQNDGLIESAFFDKFVDGMKAKFRKDEKEDELLLFPCLVQVYGSATEYIYFDENGRAEFFGCLLDGGKTFMGLAKCLLDTNNYDEVMRLASTGNRENIDTQVKDVLQDDINSPYGRFPANMPLFPFGKCMDLDKGLEDYTKEDVATSLVAFFSFMIIIGAGHVCMIKKIPKIYLSGNIFLSNLFKKEIQRIMSTFPALVNLEILDFGYFGALGAMFCSNADNEKYFKL